MKARVIITAEGEVAVMADNGTFVEGEAKIKALFAALQAKGIDFDAIAQVEQHRADDDQIHNLAHQYGPGH